MSRIDLLFIVDVTASMGGFIREAKRRMQDILATLEKKFNLDIYVGLSLYRDHPSQGDNFVTITFELMEIKEIQDKIDLIVVNGGGDIPEAVIDGIIDGAYDMKWREDSRRIAFLIGDAPAHGMIRDEDCCQCGRTWGDAVVALEDNRITLYTIALSSSMELESNFKILSNFTGGILIKSDNAMDVILETLSSELNYASLDSQVLELLSKDSSPEKICEMLNISRSDLVSAQSRIAQSY